MDNDRRQPALIRCPYCQQPLDIRRDAERSFEHVNDCGQAKRQQNAAAA